MPKILFAWIGQTDLNAAAGDPKAGVGPIASAVDALPFERIVLLCNYPKDSSEAYVRWLGERTDRPINLECRQLTSPMNFGEIYEAAVEIIQIELFKPGKNSTSRAPRRNSPKRTDSPSPVGAPELTFHISPGTSAMAAVWVILAKTRFPATLIQSSPQRGVEVASVPFDISADFIPSLLQRPDRVLERLSGGLPAEAPEFKDIICRSAVMQQVIAKARRVAPRSIPVLIEGESGTGKELLARAIHQASPRRTHNLVTVNCGAIPVELVESEMFGHEKGAFTGASAPRKGHFEEANGGTLFLDEIGELPLPAQVKLLRVLQDREVTRVGSSKPIQLDVRIIAATNRSLLADVQQGRFREDLFYRLAVAVLKLPTLRDRPGDVSLLIDHLLGQINEESAEEPGYKEKNLSAGAKKLLLKHDWPGNVRELYNTLRRAAVWSSGTTIDEEDMRDALMPAVSGCSEEILNRPLGSDLNLQEIISLVARHYLERAMQEAHGNKTKAADLLGLPSYQTLTNWLKRYNIES